MHQICFTEAFTWLVSYYNMAFCCHANFPILDQLVTQSRAAPLTGEQPLAHCIAARVAVKSSHKIYCVLVSFTDSRVYLCNSLENYGVLFQLMWMRRILPRHFSHTLYIFFNIPCIPKYFMQFSNKIDGLCNKNCKDKIKRYMQVLKGTSSAEIWKNMESLCGKEP